MFLCEYYTIFKNGFFIEILWWIVQIVKTLQTLSSIRSTPRPFLIDLMQYRKNKILFMFHLSSYIDIARGYKKNQIKIFTIHEN